MSVSYGLHRTVAVDSFSADPDPNDTPPDAADIFRLAYQPGDQSVDDATRGHALYLRFRDAGGLDVDGPTADFTTWIKDEGVAGGYVKLASEAAATHRTNYASKAIGKLFVQLTAVASVGAAVTCDIMITERVDV